MNLDIRVPMGWLFLLFGLLIGGYVVATGPLAGDNINVVWGFVLAIFGALMLGLARRQRE
jgi:hypothetical protein